MFFVCIHKLNYNFLSMFQIDKLQWWEQPSLLKTISSVIGVSSTSIYFSSGIAFFLKRMKKLLVSLGKFFRKDKQCYLFSLWSFILQLEKSNLQNYSNLLIYINILHHLSILVEQSNVMLLLSAKKKRCFFSIWP